MKTIVPFLAVISCLGGPAAQPATGDLDPSFGDHGRQVLIPGAFGAARSIELPATGDVFVGGSTIDFHANVDGCSIVHSIFAGEPGSELVRLGDIEAIRMARLADGRIVGVGRRVAASGLSGRCFVSVRNLAVFRLEADGSPDAGFGADGIFDWDPGEQGGANQGRSLLPENDGRIVVAGTGGFASGDTSVERLVVLRLLSDGSLDSSFGEGGVFLGPSVQFHGDVRIVRGGSGYRVVGAGDTDCIVAGLMADGSPDNSFGNQGTAIFTPTGSGPVDCNALEALANGSLLLAGNVRNRAFVVRLHANGSVDATFTPDSKIATSLTTVTAVTATESDEIFVAGSGPKGTAIMRLHASGQLDTAYGNSGRTWIDLPPDVPSATTVYDMALGTDGSILAAGGAQPYVLRLLGGAPPFVVRLLGDAGGPSGGVVSFLPDAQASAVEGSDAVIKVRRSGGSDGDVSVGYRTLADANAKADQDFIATEGTLYWTSGDRSDREIRVRIAGGNDPPEGHESFHVALNDMQGDAGFGKKIATIDIRPDGSPGGLIQLSNVSGRDPSDAIAYEDDTIQLTLVRNYYAAGRVCVTVNTHSGTAVAGEDFAATTSIVCWEDGDRKSKLVDIAILGDNLAEESEVFTIEVSNATGGAILGLQTLATVTIQASLSERPPPNGGGGPAGAIDLLLLAALLLRLRGQCNYRV